MAYVNVARAAHHGLADRVASLIAELKERREKNRVYRTTLRELSSLNARELNDLGINRSMIRSIAYEAAHGK